MGCILYSTSGDGKETGGHSFAMTSVWFMETTAASADFIRIYMTHRIVLGCTDCYGKKYLSHRGYVHPARPTFYESDHGAR